MPFCVSWASRFAGEVKSLSEKIFSNKQGKLIRWDCTEEEKLSVVLQQLQSILIQLNVLPSLANIMG